MTKLPEGWTVVQVDSIADVQLGRQRSPQNVEGPLQRPYLRAANITWRGLDVSDVKQMNFTDEEMSTYRLHPGDILLNEASGSASEVGKPALFNGEVEDCAFQNHLIRLRCHSVDTQFLLHFLMKTAVNGEYVRRSQGVGINHLGKKTLATWPVPLPPTAEQAEIVRILDTELARIDNVLRSVQAVRDKADQFRRSLLHAAFTGQLTQPDPSRGDALPEGWQTVSISDLAGDGPDSLFTDGDWVESKDQDPDGPIRLTQLADVGDGLFRDRSNRWMNCEQAERLGVTFLSENDLLVARMPDPLGRCCLVPKMPYKAVTVVDVAILRVTQANPHLVMHFINSPALRQLIEAESSGTTRRRISRKRLSSIEFPLPPSTEQDKIVRILGAQLTRLEKALEFADRVELECGRLRRSLLQAAFTGELTRKWRESRG